MLLTGFRPAFGAVLAAVLFTAFSAGIAWSLLRKRSIPCGCFGISSAETTSALTLVRSLLLTTLSLLIVLSAEATEAVARPTLTAAVPAYGAALMAAVVLRLLPFVREAVRSLKAQPVIGSTQSRRVSLRDLPVDTVTPLAAFNSESLALAYGLLGDRGVGLVEAAEAEGRVSSQRRLGEGGTQSEALT